MPIGTLHEIAHVDGEPGGLGWTPDGDLLVVAMKRRAVVRIDAAGEQTTVADLTQRHRVPLQRHGGRRRRQRLRRRLRLRPAVGCTAGAGRARHRPRRRHDRHRRRRAALPERLRDHTRRRADRRRVGGQPADGVHASTPTATCRIGALFADLGDTVPDGICLDAEGAVWVADPLHDAVVRVADGGEVLETAGDQPGRLRLRARWRRRTSLFVCTYDAAASASPTPQPVGRVEIARVDVPRSEMPSERRDHRRRRRRRLR